MVDGSRSGTPTADRGLRARMRSEERRINAQHERIDTFCHDVMRRIDQVGAARSIEDFLQLQHALEAHMSVEDEIYFPALHGLRPEAGPELAVLIDEHEEMRREVEGVRRLLVADDLERGRQALGALTSRIERHELVEEELIARVSTPTED